MNDLPRDIIRLLLFDYIDSEYLENWLKACRKIHNSFNEFERRVLRLRSICYKERLTQSNYIKRVLDAMTLEGERQNITRISLKKKPKKYNYYFCDGCANVIRPGIVRGTRHEKVCRKQFRKCDWCENPYTISGRYGYSRGLSRHAGSLQHREHLCPKRVI